MKIYVVVIEREGLVTKSPGVSDVKLHREDMRFAAETITEVWEAIEHWRNNEAVEVIGVWQEQPAITVINGDTSK